MSNMRHVILSAFAGIGLGLFAGGKFIGRQYEKHCELIEKQADRFSETSALMQQWVKVYQSGHNLQDYFKKNNYRKIAVYGMSEIGYMILKELEETEIEVLYCIDKNADNPRGAILAYGTFLLILIHLLINFLGILALIPLTGVPVPF